MLGFIRFLIDLLLTCVMVSAGLATIITLSLHGLPILSRGLPMCVALYQNDMLDRLLYTACGCALVEIILLPLAGFALWVFIPRLIRHFKTIRQFRSRR